VRYMLRFADANYDFSDTLSVCPAFPVLVYHERLVVVVEARIRSEVCPLL